MYISTALGLPYSRTLQPSVNTLVTTPNSPATTQIPLVATQTSVPTQSSETLSLYIIVGVNGVVVVLIAAAVIVVSVTVCLRRRKSKHVNILADNVAYGVSENEMELSINAAYDVTCDSSRLQDNADTYDYATTDVSIITAPNNQAYGMVEH